MAKLTSMLMIVTTLCCGGNASQLTADEPPDFETQVAPILVKRCLECHQESETSGGLSLATHEQLLQGGDSGAVVAIDGTATSYLVERIVAGEMPPEKKGQPQKLPADEISLLMRWVQAGANWPAGRTLDLFERTTDLRGGRDWWSLQPVNRPVPPTVFHAERVANPVDAFVLARLEQAGMEPAPLAGRRQLIRRVYYDVVGLPPTYDQVEAFVADQRTGAWKRVVETLLSSPHYGERWARYWLDLVRFADTCGYERDQEKPFAWRYRDWVVDALNDDMPYDRFVHEQLAGDELADRSERSVVATALMRLGTWNDEPNEPQDYKYERLEDLVHVTSSAFLGLTVKCARCHDHKFDPIPQVDYYRLAAVFWPGAIEPRDGKLLGGPSAEELGYENVLGWSDLTANPPPLHLLKQGNRHQPGDVVAAGPLSAVSALDEPFQPPPTGSKTTMRRLQLAQWIVDKRNPLTSRVFVNRLWQHHFGAGLVRTPNNFGFRGDLPTHPQLLDWLADQLVDGGWKIKRLHKLILMSQTYRQSTLHPKFDEYQVRDPANRLWWRAERQRLDAESLRDSMLLVTGELDRTIGGPSFRPTVSSNALEGLSRKDAAWNASPPEQQLRRSLYMYTQRSLLTPLMTTFDFCDTVSPCGRRDVTIVPTQALALLNNAFSHDRSMALARRVLNTAAKNRAKQVRLTWKYALGRMPTDDQQQLGVEHLTEQRSRFAQQATVDLSPDLLSLASLCHVVMNSSEFIFTD